MLTPLRKKPPPPLSHHHHDDDYYYDDRRPRIVTLDTLAAAAATAATTRHSAWYDDDVMLPPLPSALRLKKCKRLAFRPFSGVGHRLCGGDDPLSPLPSPSMTTTTPPTTTTTTDDNVRMIVDPNRPMFTPYMHMETTTTAANRHCHRNGPRRPSTIFQSPSPSSSPAPQRSTRKSRNLIPPILTDEMIHLIDTYRLRYLHWTSLSIEIQDRLIKTVIKRNHRGEIQCRACGSRDPQHVDIKSIHCPVLINRNIPIDIERIERMVKMSTFLPLPSPPPPFRHHQSNDDDDDWYQPPPQMDIVGRMQETIRNQHAMYPNDIPPMFGQILYPM